MNNPDTYSVDVPVIELDDKSRGRFIARTYNHLFAAICAFTLIEIGLFQSGLAEPIARAMLSGSWLWVLGGFMLLSWFARSVVYKTTSKASQYAALAVYIVGQALIFVPMLFIADKYAPGAIASAALITFIAFTALTLVVFITPQRFFFPARPPDVGRHHCPGDGFWWRNFRLPTRHLFLGGDGGSGRRSHPV